MPSGLRLVFASSTLVIARVVNGPRANGPVERWRKTAVGALEFRQNILDRFPSHRVRDPSLVERVALGTRGDGIHCGAKSPLVGKSQNLSGGVWRSLRAS